MLGDGEGRVRRRAALAVGRVGLAEGVEPLARLLANDPDPEVRQMVAFALGILGDRVGRHAALPRRSPTARRSSRAARRRRWACSTRATRPRRLRAMAAGYVAAGALTGVTADDLTYPMRPGAEAVRLALYALARLKAFDGVASRVARWRRQPVTAWWPVAYALRRVEDPRAVPALMALSGGRWSCTTRAFAARGLGVLHHRDGGRRARAARGRRRAASRRSGSRQSGHSARCARSEAVPALVTVARLPHARRGRPRRGGDIDGGRRAPAADVDALLDLLSEPGSPRCAPLLSSALAALDRERFLLALSGLDPDPEWSVRAAVATACGTLPPDTAAAAAAAGARDRTRRCSPAVFAAIAAAKVPGAEAPLIAGTRRARRRRARRGGRRARGE